MELLSRNTQIFVLDQDQKDEIENELYAQLLARGIDEDDIDFHVANGMDSKLSDIEEVVDIDNLELTKISR